MLEKGLDMGQAILWTAGSGAIDSATKVEQILETELFESEKSIIVSRMKDSEMMGAGGWGNPCWLLEWGGLTEASPVGEETKVRRASVPEAELNDSTVEQGFDPGSG